ncbi:hypothetical protein COLO4_32750 [Corchorus olitorius]|uniref:Uncharacterized protein n=1 Tax=Corchorus olitorius TaxID=93759 RepID=A0A1R3GYG2_9ROSI|nr:hypothetical protein COLO4_32750 [Corchorus olitorius]
MGKQPWKVTPTVPGGPTELPSHPGSVPSHLGFISRSNRTPTRLKMAAQ